MITRSCLGEELVMVGFRRAARVCIVIVIMMAAPGRAAAAQRAGIVTGIVDDDTKSPLVGVVIVLEPADGGRAPQPARTLLGESHGQRC